MKKLILPITFALALALALAPPSHASAKNPGVAVDNYCSPGPTYCMLVVRKANRDIEFRLRSFSHRGRVRICVARRDKKTCLTYRFGIDENGVRYVFVPWRRFPYRGRGRYAVAFFSGSKRIGIVLHFTGTPAGR